MLVIGATGNVGREVIKTALNQGLKPVAAVRNITKAKKDFGEDLSMVKFDFYDRNTWFKALEAQKFLFLLRPPAISEVEETLNPFIDVAKQAGIEHIIFLSVAGAEKNKFIPHRKVEDHLISLDAHYTILRPGFFAQNLQDAYRLDIIESDRIMVPAGHTPVNWIDVRDVAEVATLILRNPFAHAGKAYTLAGPGPVLWEEVVESLSDVLGRDIQYQAVSIPRYIFHLKKRGLSRGAIIVQTIIHVLLRLGQGAIEDNTLERLLGHPSRTIETYIRENAEIWQI
ncbi:NAD(P)H-binding protein [Cyanothece sp. BG0011]|uniref:NmrA family NAD(P)-binding protein n=1 Tax=Cyanothece sp. BG0011 TaxID=2082950 RepID=UPI000D1EAB2E|nr:NAD(P)H-binding protein [Cyanothece sp. BG0011]